MTARPLTASEARAWLVDHVATLRRDAELMRRDNSPDRAALLDEEASRLSAFLRRWDPARHPPE